LELVTKSGTNELHGTVGYLYTNNSLTARTIAQSEITDFAQKNLWATAGGPIKRNKTFVFGAFDFLRASTATTRVGVAETPEFRNYVTSNHPESIAARIFQLSPAIDPTSDIITVGELKQRNPGQFDRFPNGPSFPSSLDAGGYWPKQRGDPLSGLVQFAVEIKNTRSWVYPWSSELWQLLTSLSGYTDVIPVLVARRIHRCTFKLFKTVGALGWAAQRQWFSNPGDASRYRLTHQELRRVSTALAFEDMTYVTLPPAPHNKQLVNWLSNVFYKREQNGDTEIVGPRSVRLWPKAAPIINRHKCLRDSALPHSQRRQEWNSFVADREAAGFDSTDWATTEPVEPTN